MTHTPTPWKLIRYGDGKFSIEVAGASIANLVDMGDETEANGEVIVTSVNCHEELVDVLKQGRKLSEYAASIHWNPQETNTDEWLAGLEQQITAFQMRARAVLARAESH